MQLASTGISLTLLNLTIFISLIKTSITTNVIKVAHLQPNNPNIINEVITMESCNRLSGVEHAAFLHYMRNASVYFGPGCNNEMLVIGRLASRWNGKLLKN
ncbi:unnamed protein product [Meloidogyne enterolobii]|uniref:Uncharacterized protein n=1 Tax=Meloidogyne enterolobii TaxID=390850 RepID=A0ACB1AHT2_MELEN